MGQDKALIIIEGQPLAVRAATVLATSGCEPVHLVGRQQQLKGLGWPVIEEQGGPHHPLLGVAAALATQSEGLTLIAPCDLVNLSEEHVRALLNTGGPCVAYSGNHIHPLLAVLPHTLAHEAAALAAQGAPAMALSSSLPRVILPGPALLDANHPTDLPR